MSVDRDNFDSLLKRARWPEASSDSTRRLEDVWKRQWNPRRSWRIWPMAAAAMLVLGTGFATLIILNHRQKPPQLSQMPQPRRIEVKKLVMMESRAPSLRERMLVGDLRPKKRQPTTAPVQVAKIQPQDPARQQRQAIVDLLNSNNPASTEQYLELVADLGQRELALGVLDELRHPPVNALINELSNSQTQIRFAAARALARINGPATTRALVNLIERNKQKREAMAALLLMRGQDAVAYVAEARHAPGLSGTVRAVEIQLQNVQ